MNDANENTFATAELIEPGASELATCSTDELKQRLASLLATTAEGLRDMAAIVAELESRDEDLSGLRLGIVHHLRRIAAGQLLPELVVRCAAVPRILAKASILPLSDQQRIAGGEPFPLAVWRGDSVEWRQIDPLEATGPQFSQIFASDHVRSQQEQISLLEDRRERARRTPEPPKKGRLRADRNRGVLIFGKSVFSPADVTAALADLAEPFDENAVREHTTVCKVSEAEHQKLKLRAIEGHTTVQHLIYRSLRAAGLI